MTIFRSHIFFLIIIWEKLHEYFSECLFQPIFCSINYSIITLVSPFPFFLLSLHVPCSFSNHDFSLNYYYIYKYMYISLNVCMYVNSKYNLLGLNNATFVSGLTTQYWITSQRFFSGKSVSPVLRMQLPIPLFQG